LRRHVARRSAVYGMTAIVVLALLFELVAIIAMRR
jgi:hypothetical protein